MANSCNIYKSPIVWESCYCEITTKASFPCFCNFSLGLHFKELIQNMGKTVQKYSRSGVICSGEKLETVSCLLIGEWLSKWQEYLFCFLRTMQ